MDVVSLLALSLVAVAPIAANAQLPNTTVPLRQRIAAANNDMKAVFEAIDPSWTHNLEFTESSGICGRTTLGLTLNGQRRSVYYMAATSRYEQTFTSGGKARAFLRPTTNTETTIRVSAINSTSSTTTVPELEVGEFMGLLTTGLVNNARRYHSLCTETKRNTDAINEILKKSGYVFSTVKSNTFGDPERCSVRARAVQGAQTVNVATPLCANPAVVQLRVRSAIAPLLGVASNAVLPHLSCRRTADATSATAQPDELPVPKLSAEERDALRRGVQFYGTNQTTCVL